LYRVFFRQGFTTICPGRLQTAILQISASQVARITGLSHWSLALSSILKHEMDITKNSLKFGDALIG
jgi:hypothetical protein